jgi:hypothetical protein
MSHDRRGDDAADVANTRAVAAFLRALASRAEADATFAAHLMAALRESGLASALTGERSGAAAPPTRGARARGARAAAEAPADAPAAPPDPFSIYRAQGEERLRATLDALDLATLRAIVRAHRLDPARISARWTTRERVIGLIVDQVKARANHGRAFERV